MLIFVNRRARPGFCAPYLATVHSVGIGYASDWTCGPGFSPALKGRLALFLLRHTARCAAQAAR